MSKTLPLDRRELRRAGRHRPGHLAGTRDARSSRRASPCSATRPARGARTRARPAHRAARVPRRSTPSAPHARRPPARVAARAARRPSRPARSTRATPRTCSRCCAARPSFASRARAQALVTAPVQKSVITQSGVAFSGHTELLAELTGAPQPVMLLAGKSLRVALATTHLPLRAVAAALDRTKLESLIRITHRDLQRRFRIERPRMLVLGLNPHAGESGTLGTEEQCDHRAGRAYARGGRPRRDRPRLGRHGVHARVARTLRRRRRDVSRPRLARAESALVRRDRQRDARAADRAHVGRSRHGVARWRARAARGPTACSRPSSSRSSSL